MKKILLRMFLFCRCWPFCLIPFCCGSLNVTEHYCSNCDKLLGKYKGWKGKADPWSLSVRNVAKSFIVEIVTKKFMCKCVWGYIQWSAGRKIFLISSQSLNKAVAKGQHYNVTIVTKMDKLGVRSVEKWDILKILWQTVLRMGALCAENKHQCVQLLFFAVFVRNNSFLKL